MTLLHVVYIILLMELTFSTRRDFQDGSLAVGIRIGTEGVRAGSVERSKVYIFVCGEGYGDPLLIPLVA